MFPITKVKRWAWACTGLTLLATELAGHASLDFTWNEGEAWLGRDFRVTLGMADTNPPG
jgi:hypothetical protein